MPTISGGSGSGATREDVPLSARTVWPVKVQGSRPSPYRVSIEVKTLTPAEWKKVAARLGEEAL